MDMGAVSCFTVPLLVTHVPLPWCLHSPISFPLGRVRRDQSGLQVCSKTRPVPRPHLPLLLLTVCDELLTIYKIHRHVVLILHILDFVALTPALFRFNPFIQHVLYTGAISSLFTDSLLTASPSFVSPCQMTLGGDFDQRG
jgi:hypothetical protein